MMSDWRDYSNVSWFITFYLNVNEDEEKDSRHWIVKMLFSLYISESEWKKYALILNKLIAVSRNEIEFEA